MISEWTLINQDIQQTINKYPFHDKLYSNQHPVKYKNHPILSKLAIR